MIPAARYAWIALTVLTLTTLLGGCVYYNPGYGYGPYGAPGYAYSPGYVAVGGGWGGHDHEDWRRWHDWH